MLTALTRRSIGSGPVNRFVRIWGFKESHALQFLHRSPLFLQGFSNFGLQRLISVSFGLIKAFWIGFQANWRLEFWILATFSSFQVSQSTSSHFAHAQGFSCECFSLYSHYSLVSSCTWLLGESLLPLRHRASAQLSHLSWRHTKR